MDVLKEKQNVQYRTARRFSEKHRGYYWAVELTNDNWITWKHCAAFFNEGHAVEYINCEIDPEVRVYTHRVNLPKEKEFLLHKSLESC